MMENHSIPDASAILDTTWKRGTMKRDPPSMRVSSTRLPSGPTTCTRPLPRTMYVTWYAESHEKPGEHMEWASMRTRSAPSPTSRTSGRLAVLSTTTRPPPGMSTSSGASRQLSATPARSCGEGAGSAAAEAGSLTMPEAGWLDTSLAASGSGRSHARDTNSVDRPVKMPADPVSWKLVNCPRLWPLEVSPRKSTVRSACAAGPLCHHVTAPKGSASASPSFTATTFSFVASGRTRPQAAAAAQAQQHKQLSPSPTPTEPKRAARLSSQLADSRAPRRRVWVRWAPGAVAVQLSWRRGSCAVIWMPLAGFSNLRSDNYRLMISLDWMVIKNLR
uniref:Uncharacterized protein n=1 Tax=Zea mays TaxID=4577 RepID=A0A804PS23_MAIZE